MKSWIRWAGGSLLALTVAALVLLVGLLALALDHAPAVAERTDVRIEDVQHALTLARSHDPRRSTPGQLNQLSVTERDVELLLNHGAKRLLGMRVALTLQAQQGELQASLPWKFGPLGGWLNLQTTWQETVGLPALARWRVGSLPLPTALARPLLHAAAVRLGVARADLQLVPQVVQQVRFGADRMDVAYIWQTDTSNRLLSALTPLAEQGRLQAYNALLTALTQRNKGWTTPLPDLLLPMFELARQRSEGTENAAQENRAAVLTLALYVTGRRLGSVVPAARGWPQPRQLKVLLAGRDDFPQHFLVSAFLAMEGTSPLTDAIGLAKEVADANGGSGFSFTDLAANRAGLRFGQMAVLEPLQLQQRLARGADEAGLVPPMADLPEFMQQAEFEAFYGQVGSPPYQRVLVDIEARLNALPLYR
jgi:hypothetical protein